MKAHAGVYLVSLGSALGVTIGCGDKSPTYVYPNAPGSGGSSGAGTTTGGAFSAGGSAGSGVGAGGASGSGSGTGGVATCPTDPNLIVHGNWIGCDPALTTDNPMGLQGALYAYGDEGRSCTIPENPCGANGCCISGATIVDNVNYDAWGCGLGLELNSTGGPSGMKLPYTGPVQCFDIALTGSSGGNKVRIGYPYAADMDGKVAPFFELTEVAGSWSGTVCFDDVACPTWDTTGRCMLGDKYDLQIQVVGGDAAGAFDLCLTSLLPHDGSGPGGLTTLGQLCGAVGTIEDNINSGPYRIQNNVYGGGSQCITAKGGNGAAGFTIDSATLSTSGDSPIAYPSIVYGWHYGAMTQGTGLPKTISSIVSAPSALSYTAGSGKFNAAYDIWVHPQSTGQTTGCGNSTQCPNGGLEIMIWLGSGGNAVPYGSAGPTVTINDQSFEVWTGQVNGQWEYVAYWLKSGASTFSGDLKPFMVDAVGRSGPPDENWYVLGIQFGFEIWNYGGPGFAVTSFTQSVN